MELVAASLFIPLVIVAVVQMVKMAAPGVVGWATIVVAFAVGVLVALVDVYIGVTDISVAQGLLYALGAIGLTSTFKKASNNG